MGLGAKEWGPAACLPRRLPGACRTQPAADQLIPQGGEGTGSTLPIYISGSQVAVYILWAHLVTALSAR